MNVALCTFFCVQRHIHTLARTVAPQQTMRTRKKGAPGAAFREPMIIGIGDRRTGHGLVVRSAGYGWRLAAAGGAG